MSYTKASSVLPHALLRAVQQYIDGEYLYIPRKEAQRLPWGAKTQTRSAIKARNREILSRHTAGSSVTELAARYFLSTKTIYKILNAAKNG